jgi:RNA polymerase sigma-B factor
MHATTVPAASRTTPRRAAATEADDRAAALMDKLTALPSGHRSRARVRDEVITAWLPMAHRLARRYVGRGEPLDDLVQTATIGLIKAIDRYDPRLGTDFPGYAIPTILGEIKRHFRDRTWSIRVPRRLQELRMAISEAHATLLHRHGRSATVADIAEHLGISEETVIEGLEGALAYRAASLSTPIGTEGSAELGDRIGSDDHEFDLTDLRLALEPAMARLTEREQRIITLRFYGNQTQTQIAEEIGVSQMHVSRLLTAALCKLRGHLGPDCA